MRYQFINAEKADNCASRLCDLFKVSRSGFYAWKERPLSLRQREDQVLLARIRSEFESSYRSYGRPRMVEELREQGFKVGHHRVGRLMQENGIQPVRTKKSKRYYSHTPVLGFAPNLLDRNFMATEPNQKWSVDISYIETRRGWLYLAVVIDLYSRKVIGWAVSEHMRKDLALRALRMAITLRRPGSNLIHHSDRGSQYCATEYQMELKRHGIQISMSRKGNCYDNAPSETFFKTLKAELVWRTKFESRLQAEKSIGNYINTFYNARRRHSTLGNISPVRYENMAA